MIEFLSFSEDLEQALLSTDRLKAEDLVASFPDLSTQDLVEKIIVPAMDKIGEGWESGDVAMSQVYMSSRICEDLIERTSIRGNYVKQPSVKIAIAVLEDYHLLGKQIIYSILKGVGYNMKDYGRVTVDELVAKVLLEQVDILLISTLMLRSALRVSEVKKQLQERGVDIKIIVGGAPFRFDTDLWQEVGADATAINSRQLLPILEDYTKELLCRTR
mgnify:CR=1 FL=1